MRLIDHIKMLRTFDYYHPCYFAGSALAIWGDLKNKFFKNGLKNLKNKFFKSNLAKNKINKKINKKK
jgi:hypothetical protein